MRAIHFGLIFEKIEERKQLKQQLSQIEKSHQEEIEGITSDYEARLDQRRAEAKVLGDAHAIQATRITELEAALENLKATHEAEIRTLIDAHAAELAKAISSPA